MITFGITQNEIQTRPKLFDTKDKSSCHDECLIKRTDTRQSFRCNNIKYTIEPKEETLKMPEKTENITVLT